MAGEYQFSLTDVTKQAGTKTILQDVNLSFFYGAHIGVIGANGAGKSSLLKILAGIDKDIVGKVQVAKGTKVGYLPQEPELDDSKTVLETVMEGVAEAQAMVERYEELCCELDDPKAAAEMEKLQEIIDRNDYWNLENLVERRMADMGCPDGSKSVSVLSGGERRRVAIARLLLSNPDVLLMDEPTNHLDAETTFRLEAYLKDFKGTLIVVTHDRYFLSDVTEWILEIDKGICYPYKGNYEEWLKQKEAMMAREAKMEKSRQKLLENELKWIQTNPSGRHAKAKARVERYEELQKQEVSTREDDLVIRIPPGPRLGNLVVRAEHVKMGFGDQVLYDDLNFDLPRGGIVGVIGANGAGKTTLFRLITGESKPLSGTLSVGETVKLAYVDQTRSELKAEETVYEAITGGGEFVRLAGATMMNGRAYCSRFNFRGAEQQKKVGVLSGGERNRVHLAKLLASGGNLLLLDEPTNDLDVATLRSLEEGLQDFGGCVMVVSHDRWFLDRIATHILAFEGNGRTTWFEGGFSEYHAWRESRKG
ncbi:MAG: energy-dependent translational throttle protein EttA [Kiritimatiellae bacterium]|nr:energy-dependent translational throttle protein EttA [Kiritimatiellia bacterium]